jgi:hypothetical protein
MVYVDDIVVTDNDQEGIEDQKQRLFNRFETKVLGRLCYFLGIEVAQSQEGIRAIAISQRKYVLKILNEL